jgi:hypothetical protein
VCDGLSIVRTASDRLSFVRESTTIDRSQLFAFFCDIARLLLLQPPIDLFFDSP